MVLGERGFLKIRGIINALNVRKRLNMKKVSGKTEKKKLYMKLSMVVVGKEGLDVNVEYKDTTIETVRLVENALMQALANVNK